LQRGHEESGGNAFAGDVGHDEHELSAGGGVCGGVEGVVVIPGDGILRASVEGDIGVRNGRRSGRDEPGLDFASDFEVALHGDFVGELEGEKQEEDHRGNKFGLDLDGIARTELEFYSGKYKEYQSDKEKNPARRRELTHHGPEELLGDAEGAFPSRELVDFVPVDVFAVEAVAGASVGGELLPEVVDVAAFADALPENPEASGRGGTRLGRAGSRRGGGAHGEIIGERKIMGRTKVS